VLPAALAAHLASGTTTLCRCWRLARADGVVMGFTDHDRELVFGGLAYSAMTGLAASGDVTKAGLAVGGLEIAGALSSAGLEAGDLEDGVYDGAAVELWLVNWRSPEERVLLRRGTLGEVTREDGAFSAEVRGPMQALETIRGRVFGKGCDADLGDGRCRVDVPALTRAATVVAIDGVRVTVTGVADLSAGWLADGIATVTTGPAAGLKRAIAHHVAAGEATLVVLRGAVPELAKGHVLTLSPGCDKRFETCAAKFQNALNFRGFPHLPGNDRALGYAREAS
jgi:uncharacterized phage protein (TIGR02218 family)